MLSNKYYTKELLGIKDANILEIKNDGKIIHIFFDLERKGSSKKPSSGTVKIF